MDELDQTAADKAPAEPTLAFWVTDEPEEGEEGEDTDTKGLFGRRDEDDDTTPVLRQVPLGPLRKNLTETVDALQQLFADAAAREGTLPLAEATLSVQVTATGGIQLIGTGQMQGTRGLTLTFKRPS
ncbi:Pepco domain-containing protein [Streptomyces sp. NPDC002851]